MEINKNDEYYLERMLTYINFIYEYVDNINDSESHIMPNDQNSDGVIYKFIQLREEAKNLSDDILTNNKPLNKSVASLSGFRNRLTHDYNNVSYSYFDEIIKNDLPELEKIIKEILSK